MLMRHTPMRPRQRAISVRRPGQPGWNTTACCAASTLPAGSAVFAAADDAAAYLQGKPGNILLATGAKELPAFAALEPERLYPRVLPTVAGITACEAAGIPHRNIVAMQSLYRGIEYSAVSSVPDRFPCHQGRRRSGRLCRKGPCCRAVRCAADRAAPPHGAGRVRRSYFTAMQGAIMKITLIGMGGGTPAA